MPNMIDVVLWVAMNENEEFVVTMSEAEALCDLVEGKVCSCARVIKVTVRMSPPLIPEVSVAVPDDAGKTVEVPHVGD